MLIKKTKIKMTHLPRGPYPTSSEEQNKIPSLTQIWETRRVEERSRGRRRCFRSFCSRVSWWLSSTLEGLLGGSGQEEEEEEEEAIDGRIYD